MTEASVSADSNLLGDSSSHYLGEQAPSAGSRPSRELGARLMPLAIQGQG